MKLNEIPSMVNNVFIAPNTVLVGDKGFHTYLKTTVDETWNENFSLDAHSFDVLKKLTTDRKIEKKGVTVSVKSKEGKYKCQDIATLIPNLTLESPLFSFEYNLKDIKNATKFTTNMNFYNGVLFTDGGSVYSTDRAGQIYYISTGGKEENMASVPIDFINMLPSQEKIGLAFTRNKVWFEKDDLLIVSDLYSGSYIDLMAVVKKQEEGMLYKGITLKKPASLSFVEGEDIKITFREDKSVIYEISKENENFVIEGTYEGEVHEKIKKRFNFKYLVQALSMSSDDIRLDIGSICIKVNDKLILCQMVMN